jgi:hypothetical protein
LALPPQVVPRGRDVPPGPFDVEIILQLIRHEEGLLGTELEDLDRYRDYYEGTQSLVFATQEFQEAFGETFQGFRDNWCEVVVDTVEDRLDVQRISLRDESSDDPLNPDDDPVWQVFLNNEFEEIQSELYNNALVEGRSAILVWPDDELGARIDAQVAQNFKVTYHPDDKRRPIWAIKRWFTEAGEARMTVYFSDFIYKFRTDGNFNIINNVVTFPNTGSSWVIRPPQETGDPSWPLPNPLGMVPIVEFRNRGDVSEIINVIPQQDALNKSIVNMMVASEFHGFPQRYIISSNKAPAEGWASGPGTIWEIEPEVDIDGKSLPTEVGSLDAADPSSYIKIIEFFKEDIAATSRTPIDVFGVSSQRGQRGDAPSGESRRVGEGGLIKKVEKLQARWSKRWVMVARLVAAALGDADASVTRGDVIWANPQAHYYMLLLEEGRKMIQELGLPPEMAWKRLGMDEAEIADALAYFKEREAREERMDKIDPEMP